MITPDGSSTSFDYVVVVAVPRPPTGTTLESSVEVRLHTFIKLLLIATGLAIANTMLGHHTRRSRRHRTFADLDPERLPNDPTDPLQGVDEVAELRVVPLAVDAQPEIEALADEDLAVYESELEDVVDAELVIDDPDAPVGDVGDLYGAHTPPAADREHPDGDRSFDEGQNWLEALETSATEYGPVPEKELDDIVDDEDVYGPPHASDTRDRPVADRGSGGRGGL
jgi:hypothetical protein